MVLLKSNCILLLILIGLSPSLCAEYNETDAAEYVYASSITHCPIDSILSWTCGRNCQKLSGYQPFYLHVYNLSVNHTFTISMLHNPHKQRFITAYRGTNGAFQMTLEFLQGGSTPYKLSQIPGAEAAAYFYNHYVKDLRPTVIAQLKEASKAFPNYQFIFTGHSLGAALTTLTAFDAVSEKIIPGGQAQLYNFGSPRVGNYELIRAMEAAIPVIYRVTHYRDMVPHLPPCFRNLSGACIPGKQKLGNPVLTWPAYHLKTEIFYNEESTSYRVCQGGEDRKCADQFSLLNVNTSDHDEYLRIRIGCGGAKPSKQRVDISEEKYRFLRR